MSKYRIKEMQRFAFMFKALSNPNRLSIFMRLVECCVPGTKCSAAGDNARECVGKLGKDLGIVPSTVSHHIKELNRAGLIHMERNGQNIDCWVSPKTLEDLAKFFDHANEE